MSLCVSAVLITVYQVFTEVLSEAWNWKLELFTNYRTLFYNIVVPMLPIHSKRCCSVSFVVILLFCIIEYVACIQNPFSSRMFGKSFIRKQQSSSNNSAYVNNIPLSNSLSHYEVNDNDNSAYQDTLKDLWSSMIIAPTTNIDHTSSNASENVMYNDLLKQFTSYSLPSSISNRNKYISSNLLSIETALLLRGILTICMNRGTNINNNNPNANDFIEGKTYGIRLICNTLINPDTSSSSDVNEVEDVITRQLYLENIALAACHSVNAHVIFLNRDTIDQIRNTANKELSIPSRALSRPSIVSSLIKAIQYERLNNPNNKYVIIISEIDTSNYIRDGIPAANAYDTTTSNGSSSYVLQSESAVKLLSEAMLNGDATIMLISHPPHTATTSSDDSTNPISQSSDNLSGKITPLDTSMISPHILVNATDEPPLPSPNRPIVNVILRTNCVRAYLSLSKDSPLRLNQTKFPLPEMMPLGEDGTAFVDLNAVGISVQLLQSLIQTPGEITAMQGFMERFLNYLQHTPSVSRMINLYTFLPLSSHSTPRGIEVRIHVDSTLKFNRLNVDELYQGDMKLITMSQSEISPTANQLLSTGVNETRKLRLLGTHHWKKRDNTGKTVKSADLTNIHSNPSTSGKGLLSLLPFLEYVVLSVPSDSKQREVIVSQGQRYLKSKRFALNVKSLMQLLKLFNIVLRNTSDLQTNAEMPIPNNMDEMSILSSMDDILGVKYISKLEMTKAIMMAYRLTLGTHAITESNDESMLSNQTSVRTIDDWALHSALCLLIKPSLSHLHHKIDKNVNKLTREKLETLDLDKHERALATNCVVFPDEIGVKYSQIGGLQEVKQVLKESITYPLAYPWLYEEGLAAESVRGVLLFGPPGTGKTMLAKAVATEGGASFLSIDASVIENKWLGESEKNAKAVFSLARKIAPCIIFIDEVDSVLSTRERGSSSDSDSGSTSHGTLTSVKTTLMQEWDGLRTTSDRVLVVASTNRPFDLDEAVLRRLSRRVLVDLPNFATRLNILQVLLKGNRLDSSVNLTKIAQTLDGYSGSDIREICREAVVRVCNIKAKELTENSTSMDVVHVIQNTPLRPVSVADFDAAIKKLQASVNIDGSEMKKIWDWNDRFGEVRSANRRNDKRMMSLYI